MNERDLNRGLERWRDAGLLDEATVARIVEWEACQEDVSHRSRFSRFAFAFGGAVLRPDWSGPKRRDEQLFTSRQTPGGLRWMAVQPVALFLPEHAADPTRGNQPAELWVEVTVPPRGAARPIRVKSRR